MEALLIQGWKDHNLVSISMFDLIVAAVQKSLIDIKKKQLRKVIRYIEASPQTQSEKVERQVLQKQGIIA